MREEDLKIGSFLSLATSPDVKGKDVTKERWTIWNNTIKKFMKCLEFGKNGCREQVLLDGVL